MDIKKLLGDAYKDDMTVEELTAALANLKVLTEDEVKKNYVSKDTSNKLASEAAKNRKERDDANREKTTLEERLGELEKTLLVAKHKEKFVGMGMTAEDAVTAAEAMVDGNTDKVFELQAALIAKIKSDADTDKLHNMDKPNGSATGAASTDYTKLYNDANEAGDTLAMAAAIRQQFEASQQKH